MATPSAKLKKYAQKRDFKKTPEPSARPRPPRRKPKPKLPMFVIQKHHATALHYDLRLEVDGVLKSWAVPKGPSTNPADKRLAVEVEDHPLDYADFEGVIPAGQYGGGTVIVWDHGTYRNIKTDKAGRPVEVSQALRNGSVEVWLEGKKLRGGYAIVRTRMTGPKNNWLLLKLKDEAADPKRDITADEPSSALSGRTIEEVALEGGDPRYVRLVPQALARLKSKTRA